MTPSSPNVTGMLRDWSDGDKKAQDQLSEPYTMNCIARPHATSDMKIPVSRCRPQI
jgi:hypothetical protein